MHRVLIVVDMQKDFVDGVLGTKEAEAILPSMVARIQKAKQEGRTLLFTLDTHGEDYLTTSEGRHLPVPHCLRESDGWRFHEAIAPYAAGEKVLEKPFFGAPALVDFFASIAEEEGANLDIALCGLCTDICVVTNALLLRAHLPEATLRVYQDACAGVTPARHEAALITLRACQVEVE